MKTNKLTVVTAGVTLLFSMLACNMGQSPDPFVPVPPTVSQGLTESAPATEAPANNAASACANPYMPVIAGATWSYKLTGPVPDTFTKSIVSTDASSFTDQDTFGSGVTRQGKWNCENGNLTALNPSSGDSANVSAENVSIDFETTKMSGMTLPATINAGDTWTQTLTLEGTETINGTVMPAKNQVANTCKAIGIESVTVEAGTFDAMKVECVTIMNIEIVMNDTPIQNALTINGTNWYAENIGLVKTISTGTGFDSTTELTSYSIPILSVPRVDLAIFERPSTTFGTLRFLPPQTCQPNNQHSPP